MTTEGVRQIPSVKPLSRATLVRQRPEAETEKEHTMRFMEFATIEQTLIEDRDEYARLADAALSAGQMDVFHMHARKFHEIASAVGYPDVD